MGPQTTRNENDPRARAQTAPAIRIRRCGCTLCAWPVLGTPSKDRATLRVHHFRLGEHRFSWRGFAQSAPHPCLLSSRLLTFLLLWPVAVSVFTVGPEAALDTATLARIDNFFLPIAVLVGMSGLSNRWSRSDTDRALLAFSTTWLLALALHALLVVVHVGLVDLSPVFQPFLGASLQGESRILWERAADAGRFTGIFSSPFEAGLCYSLAFLLTIGRVSADRRIPTWELMALALVLVGGVSYPVKGVRLGGAPSRTSTGRPPSDWGDGPQGARDKRPFDWGRRGTRGSTSDRPGCSRNGSAGRNSGDLFNSFSRNQALRVASGGRFSSEGTGTVQRRAAEGPCRPTANRPGDPCTRDRRQRLLRVPLGWRPP